MDRNIGEVIDKMIAEIPDEGSELRDRLAKIKRDAGYTPPEMMETQWYNVSLALRMAFKTELPPVNGWQGKVVRIVRGEE